MDPLSQRWFKSSRSGSESDCVEVAFGVAAVGVRDSKDREGPVLVLGPAAWRAFTATLRTGTLDG
ncbi:DUF397 domain-containing protein [Actinocatenispora comari]|jgi:hypothetical protein|uniref:DUF397 domain-containing protein n=1 Tax=Actinocatenispora comari TaxID=2807577 RepID=A0A8J4ADV7_9ACTN|nr:DUF397 domain-containing protein [Actinocatenispora comari]GIL28759.1 hypothetical protein NUM_40130 [Actinocatenispora comari]